MTPAIGVFDSGVGGLTILRELAERWPGENFVYLADTARLPYGTKSPQTIRQYLRQNVELLQRSELKAIVVACNSASTVLLGEPIDGPVPVFNVIEPGAEQALKVSQGKCIGVVGTRATIISDAYPKTLKKLDASVETFTQSCPLLVPIVEEGWVTDPLTNMVIYRYMNDLLGHEIDTLILGCTHYPVLRHAFARVCGPGIELVDSASSLIQLLEAHPELQLSQKPEPSRRIEILCTDLTYHLEGLIQSLIHPLEASSIQLVDISS